MYTEGVDVRVYSGKGGGGGGASSQNVLRPLSRFETHPQAKLRTFEAKLAACTGKRSISTILQKSRGMWTVTFEMTPRCFIP